MAQERFFKYKEAISSSRHNERLLGIIPAGVYCGFDTISNPLNLTGQITHGATGELFTKQDLSVSPRRGVWSTNQGVTIKEDAGIPFVLETNVGNSRRRIDILVGRHEHDLLIDGGISATYEVIRGSKDQELQPELPIPATGVYLGRFIIPAGASNMNGVIWEKAEVPGLGGVKNAKLDKINRYSEQQQLNQPVDVTIETVQYNSTARYRINKLEKGNTFVVTAGLQILDLLPNLPDGTEINLIFKGPVTLRGIGNQISDGTVYGTAEGYVPLYVGDTLTSVVQVKARQSVKLVKVSRGDDYSANNWLHGRYWHLMSISDTPERVQYLETRAQILEDLTVNLQAAVLELQPKPFTVVQVDLPDPGEFFVMTGTNWGAGKVGTIWENWYICNGRNGTRNRMGRTSVGYDPADPIYSVLGGTGGNKTYTLSRQNLPNVRLKMFTTNWQGNTQLNKNPNASVAWASGNQNGNQDYDLLVGANLPTLGTTESLNDGTVQGIDIINPYITSLYVVYMP